MVGFVDSSMYLNCKDFEQLKEYLKTYYGLPNTFPDTPAHGDQWKEFPETKGYNVYFDYDEETNSTGFRDSEVEEDVDICYYGCSMTYGVGLPLEARWTTIIDNHFNFKSNNFGISGLGAEEMLKVFMATSRFVKMKKAVFLFPTIHRYTIPYQTKEGTIIVQMHPSVPDYFNQEGLLETFTHFYSLPDTYFLDKYKIAINTIMYIAELKGIDLYFSTWANNEALLRNLSRGNKHVTVVDGVLYDERGRDHFARKHGHMGILPSKKLANDFISAIKEK